MMRPPTRTLLLATILPAAVRSAAAAPFQHAPSGFASQNLLGGLAVYRCCTAS